MIIIIIITISTIHRLADQFILGLICDESYYIIPETLLSLEPEISNSSETSVIFIVSTLSDTVRHYTNDPYLISNGIAVAKLSLVLQRPAYANKHLLSIVFMKLASK